MLLNIGYVVDIVLPQLQGEKRVVFLATLAVARMVSWMKDGIVWQWKLFLIGIRFCSLDLSLGSKLDGIENTWTA